MGYFEDYNLRLTQKLEKLAVFFQALCVLMPYHEGMRNLKYEELLC